MKIKTKYLKKEKLEPYGFKACENPGLYLFEKECVDHKLYINAIGKIIMRDLVFHNGHYALEIDESIIHLIKDDIVEL